MQAVGLQQSAVAAIVENLDSQRFARRELRNVGKRDHRVVTSRKQDRFHFQLAQRIADDRVSVQVRIEIGEFRVIAHEKVGRLGQSAKPSQVSERI